jgi:membrane protease YdiL (CAAX protease family)
MSVVSSKHPDTAALESKGWGPIEAVVLGFLAYKIPEWLMGGIEPYIFPLLPFTTNVQHFVLYGMFELLVLASVYAIMRFYGVSWRSLGLAHWRVSQVGLVIVGYFAYVVLALLMRYVVGSFMHIQDEAQQIGFAQPAGGELVLVFAMLVLLVPVVEEVLFRGFLFKGVRSGFSFPVTAVVVSTLFAVAHGQLDVGLDVFALSLVLCYLREKTQSLWPGIILHGIKNAIAFTLLFVYNIQ